MMHVSELLSAHLDEELTADEMALVTSHLETCADCTAELVAISDVRDAVRGLPMLDAPIPLLPAARRPSRWIGAVASAAAAVLAVGIVFGPGQQAEAFDLDAIAGQHTVRQAVDPGISTLRGSVGSP
jgi:anti-sigma factor RsiW